MQEVKQLLGQLSNGSLLLVLIMIDYNCLFLLKIIFPRKQNLTQVAKQLLGQLPSPTPPALARLARRRREVTLVKMVINDSDLVNLVTLPR